MAQCVALTPGVETSGEGVLAVVEGMGVFKARALKILAEHGISDPRPGEWYPLQPYLDAFRVIAETIGPVTLCAIGRRTPECAIFPAAIDSVEKALAAIDTAYHMNHRLAGRVMHNPRTGKITEGIGHYRYARLGERKVRMTCDNPYPCDLDRGIIEALAMRYKPADSLFVTVTHDDSAPCRKRGGESCTYYVEW
jgi:hypothetical protein